MDKLREVMEWRNLVGVYAVEVLEAGVTQALSEGHSREDSMIVEQCILDIYVSNVDIGDVTATK